MKHHRSICSVSLWISTVVLLLSSPLCQAAPASQGGAPPTFKPADQCHIIPVTPPQHQSTHPTISYTNPEDPSATALVRIIPRVPPPSIYRTREICHQEIRNPDRDPHTPGATGLICITATSGFPSLRPKVKIIKDVKLDWRTPNANPYSVPLRIIFEIRALILQGQLRTLPNSWGFWVDPTTVKMQPNGLPAEARGDVYIPMDHLPGETLRYLRQYREARNPDARKRVIGFVKVAVARHIMDLALTKGIFHGSLTVGSILIDWPTRPGQGVGIKFVDWGYTRFVRDVNVCNDWVLNKALFVGGPKDDKNWIPDHVKRHVDAIFQTALRFADLPDGNADSEESF